MLFDEAIVVHGRLQDLGEALELEDDATPLDLLVCGGAALAVRGYVSRATDDIDVLALVLDEQDVSAKPFPGFFESAILRVARIRGLPSDWINPGPADMQQFGLPIGIVGRAQRRSYGDMLSARFLDRYDQIHLKLYAAVDQSGGKHLADLIQLVPTSSELVDAALWCLGQDPSPGFRGALEWFLNKEGHADVVERLPQ